jgi:hypothetical protein
MVQHMLGFEQGPLVLRRTTGLGRLVTQEVQVLELQKPSNLSGLATERSYMTSVPFLRTGRFLPRLNGWRLSS